MKLYIFGSCSGTEPWEDRHHTALAFEINGRIYWFDAGENCSYTAHLMGVDLLNVSDVFISHTHMDHVGGLGNLLWNIRKLSYVKKCLPRFGDITVHIPVIESFNGILTMLKNTEDNYRTKYNTLVNKVEDKTLLENDDVKVIAKHNFHLPETEDGWLAFSFGIMAEGKKIVYSGDVLDLDDLKDLVKDGCDLLLMETGHHDPDVICKRVLENNWPVRSLYFLHHGKTILEDYDGALKRCLEIFPSVRFCNDKDVFDI